MIYAILVHFEYKHLPPVLQEVSKPFCELANAMAELVPDSVEMIFALRKLLEAKDCAVRAKIDRDKGR